MVPLVAMDVPTVLTMCFRLCCVQSVQSTLTSSHSWVVRQLASDSKRLAEERKAVAVLEHNVSTLIVKITTVVRGVKSSET